MEEEWRPIKGFERLYEVSSLGNIKTLHDRQGKERLLKPYTSAFGYKIVKLIDGDRMRQTPVHRLVAETFIENPYSKRCIDHINTIRTDNRVENLRWVTHAENSNNPLTREHLRKPRKAGYVPSIKRRDAVIKALSIKVIQLSSTGEFIREWDSASEAGRKLGIFQTSIAACCRGKIKSSGGFKWRYANE